MTPSDQITVLVPLSPLRSHPSTEIAEETIQSIRDRLPTAEIVAMCDGPVPDLDADRVDAYDEFLRRFTLDCRYRWWPALPVIHRTHEHQYRMARAALGSVRTPLVLFVEADTPLTGEWPWPGMCDAILSGRVNSIRGYHETVLQPEHAHLMIGPVEGVPIPLVRTVQYSQRPHLASTGFYRTMLDADWWPPNAGFIEDVAYSRVESAWRDHGEAGWQQWRLSVYMPEGNVQRSLHLDGRAGDPKHIYRQVEP